MFNKKNSNTLQKYWEMKLSINYKNEFEEYKKLCGYEYKKDLVQSCYSINSKLVFYDEWEKHIMNMIEKLGIYELKEYSKFLNQKSREYEKKYTLAQVIYIPLIFYVATICLTPLANSINILDENNNSSGLFIYVVFLIGVILLFLYILWVLFSSRNEPIYNYFYKDMKEIVDNKIKNMTSLKGME